MPVPQAVWRAEYRELQACQGPPDWERASSDRRSTEAWKEAYSARACPVQEEESPQKGENQRPARETGCQQAAWTQHPERGWQAESGLSRASSMTDPPAGSWRGWASGWGSSSAGWDLAFR